MNNGHRPGAHATTEAAVLQRLRRVAELLPAGASVTLTRETLLEALKAAADVATEPVDITAAELGARFQRSTSSVRGWLEAGRFPGAYKLRGRDWRVPPDAIEAFRESERAQKSPMDVDLSGWRRYVPHD